jgi:hypothetical protein
VILDGHLPGAEEVEQKSMWGQRKEVVRLH